MSENAMHFGLSLSCKVKSILQRGINTITNHCRDQELNFVPGVSLKTFHPDFCC